MNQVSYNICRFIPFLTAPLTDLLVVSAHFEEVVDVINDDETKFRKRMLDEVQQL